MNTELATIPKPVQKETVLPPEIHKAVQRWSNSFFRASIPTNLIEKSVITEINDERAKLLTAQFLYGERNGREKEIPHDDSEITNNTSNRSEESLWLYGSGLSKAPKDFSEKSQSEFSIPTGKTKKCPKCRGAGEVDCWGCKGTGRDDKGKKCPLCDGKKKRRCGKCDGYRYIQVIIVVNTYFKVEKTKEHDYAGDVPPKKLKSTSGAVIFEEVANYPEDAMKEMLKGGINPQEYAKLQSGLGMVFHSLIDKKLQNYDGDLTLVHGLVDNFFKRIPNAFKENRILEHEILPVRLKIMVEDAPVKKVSYTYKEKPYSLWIYGKENKVYAKKRPFGFTGRLLISWIIQIIIVGLVVYWLTGPHTQQAQEKQTPVQTATGNATPTHAPSYEKNLQAAQQGNSEAQADLGLMYAKGDGVAKDPTMAVQWFTKAAQQGLARAQNNLGVMYEDGNGVAKDDVEAVKWFRAAAEQGFARAQNNLGTKYVDGEGVAKDPGEAVKWFRKSAEQGYPDGQCNLGVMYIDGNGVDQDSIEAAKWFTKSAEQGFLEAQKNLGDAYFKGIGVDKDYVQAAKWFSLAAAQGNDWARDKYAEVTKLMTADQIKQAQDLTGQFLPKNGDQ